MNIFQQIKAVFKIKREVSKMKISELQTSEGRAHILLQVVSVYGALHGFIPAPLAVKVSAGLFAAYALARALVKVGEAIAKITANTKDDAIVAEAGKLLDAVAPKETAKP